MASVSHEHSSHGGQDASFNSNDSSLSDMEMSDDFSTFGPDGMVVDLEDSNSSIDMDDFFSDLDDDDDNDERRGEVLPAETNVEPLRDPSERVSADLYDITKLLQLEYTKNPLSTQQILTREVCGIYKSYGEHGSYLRLSENVRDFLELGDTAVRPTTRKHIVKYTTRDMRTGIQKVVEREELVNDLDRIKMSFAETTDRQNSANGYTVGPKAEGVYRTMSACTPIQPDDRSTTTVPIVSTVPMMASQHGHNIEQQDNLVDNDDVVHVKSIKELLPVEVPLNHHHPFAITNDPDNHKFLEPNHPQAIPFTPLGTEFAMPRTASLPAGALKALNNIFLLTSLNAQHTLNWLQIKYTPHATATRPNPPAPPFALFRLAIQQLVNSTLKKVLASAGTDPSGLTPRVRTLLRDLHTNHQRGRGGMNSSQSYYSIDEELRSDSWLTGREHITTPHTTTTTTTAAVVPGTGNTTTTTTTTTQIARAPPSTNANSLNHVEKQVLQRATGIIDPNAFENWWDDATEEKRAWGWLRKWIREVEVKKVLEAKRDGRY